MKFCKDCKYWKCAHDGSPAGPPPSMWYYQLCSHLAVQAPPKTDPVTGEKGFSKRNSLGTEYLDDDSRPYCRDVNVDGNCEHFQAETVQ